MKKLLVILGPTVTGKTDLAIFLAKKFNGELVACDSRQVYVGLDIGTGKLPSGRWKVEDGRWKKNRGFWEIDDLPAGRQGIKVWLYDAVSLKKQYTVVDYIKNAQKVIGEIKNRNKLPIIVGGTGLYLRAILEGLPNLGIPVNKKIRTMLEKLTVDELQKKLQNLSIEKLNELNSSDRFNPRRLVRAIELEVGKEYWVDKGNLGNQGIIKNFNVLKIGLTAPREILYRKINKRVDKWIEEGIIEEVKNLRKLGVNKKRFKQLGMEYSVIIDYLDGKINFEQMREKMKMKVRQYAKRQITWFKKEKDVLWFNIIGKDFAAKVEKEVSGWYY